MPSEKLRSVSLLFVAEIAAISLWFVSSAILGDIRQEQAIGEILAAALSSSVPAGFVVGALLIASTGLADRIDPRRVFALAAVIAGLANLAVLWIPVDSPLTVLCRFVTGFCLAGVYPVGMKIVVGWGVRDRGWLVGLLVGGLTLGSASPHLLSWFGGANWRLTTVAATVAACVAAALVLLVRLGPHHAKAARFELDAAKLAWTDKRIRLAILGYLGHMWELYAMWAWIGTAVAVSFTMQMNADAAAQLAKLTAFVAIAGGALLCPVAGVMADRLGKARVTILAMSVSSLSALLAALVFGGPVWLVFAVVVLWGLSIIPDSAQFSALIVDYAPPAKAGSLMTLQTALGFALTILTVQSTPFVAEWIGWRGVFIVLAVGPLLGILAMRRLAKLV